MSSVPSFVRLLALTALGLAMTAAPRAQAPAAPDAPGCDAPLPLVWIDGGRTSPAVLVEAEREASRIWAPAGIAFEWTRSNPSRLIRAGEVLVMVREHLAGRPRADLRLNRRHALGRVILAEADRPSRLIELVLPAVARSVQGERMFGRAFRDLPDAARTLLVGRALGRVLAHEIGHWLFGREHTPHGLMRASISRRALASPIAPALPPAWPSQARDRLLARRACARPCAVPQPATAAGPVTCL